MDDLWILDQLPGEIDIYPMSSIERFERAFCTNFTCCNILFPDLHALLDHYEYSDPESHLPPMTTLSTPKLTITPFSISYSPASSPPSSPSTHSTHSSLSDASPGSYRDVCNAPLYHPTCPSSEATPSTSQSLGLGGTDSAFSPGSQPCICQPDAYAFSDYPTYEHCYDAAKRYLASSPPLCSPAPTIEILPSNSLVHTAPKSGIGVPIPTDKRRGRPPSSASGAILKDRRKRRGKGKTDVAGVGLKRRRSRKVYPCPNPGCSKSYLNPNGLKYHQEKGTCKIELSAGVQPSAAAITAPLSTITPIITAPVIAPTTTDLSKSPSPLSDVPMTPEQVLLHRLDCTPPFLAGYRHRHKEIHPQPSQLRVCNAELREKRQMEL